MVRELKGVARNIARQINKAPFASFNLCLIFQVAGE